MNYLILSYSIYLPLAVALTIWVAHTLYRNGKVFLVDIFHGQDELAASVNRLLQTGFYLISLGYAIIKLKITSEFYYDAYNVKQSTGLASIQDVMEVLSYKVGAFILVLGGLLFFNLFMLLILRSNAKESRRVRSQFVPPADILGKA
jgi:hypothetical protein